MFFTLHKFSLNQIIPFIRVTFPVTDATKNNKQHSTSHRGFSSISAHPLFPIRKKGKKEEEKDEARPIPTASFFL